MYSLMCPNAVAREQLELTFGRRGEYLSSRRRLEERTDLYQMASNLMAQGIVRVVDEADVARSDSDGLRQLEWVGNLGLNEILEAVSCAQIKLAQQALFGWLDSIDAGQHPDNYTWPWCGPHLRKTPAALDMMTWSPPSPSAEMAPF